MKNEVIVRETKDLGVEQMNELLLYLIRFMVSDYVIQLLKNNFQVKLKLPQKKIWGVEHYAQVLECFRYSLFALEIDLDDKVYSEAVFKQISNYEQNDLFESLSPKAKSELINITINNYRSKNLLPHCQNQAFFVDMVCSKEDIVFSLYMLAGIKPCNVEPTQRESAYRTLLSGLMSPEAYNRLKRLIDWDKSLYTTVKYNNKTALVYRITDFSLNNSRIQQQGPANDEPLVRLTTPEDYYLVSWLLEKGARFSEVTEVNSLFLWKQLLDIMIRYLQIRQDPNEHRQKLNLISQAWGGYTTEDELLQQMALIPDGESFNREQPLLVAQVEGLFRSKVQTFIFFGQPLTAMQDISTLIQAGADVNAIIINDMTAIQLAAYYKHEELFMLCLEHGADITVKKPDSNHSLLGLLTEYRHIFTEDAYGLIAFREDQNEEIAHLINGDDDSLFDRMITSLLAEGPFATDQINQLNSDGYTPLMNCATCFNLQMLELILSFPSTLVLLVNKQGKTTGQLLSSSSVKEDHLSEYESELLDKNKSKLNLPSLKELAGLAVVRAGIKPPEQPAVIRNLLLLQAANTTSDKEPAASEPGRSSPRP